MTKNKNKNHSQTTINIIGFSSSLLILLIGFFLKSNSLKIIGVITGISTGIYSQLASKKLEQKSEIIINLPESKTAEVIPPSSEIIEEKEEESEILTNLPELKRAEVIPPSSEIIEKTDKKTDKKPEIKESVIKYQYLEDEEIIKQTIDQLSNNSILWLDTETADWDKPTKRISLLQITANPNDLTGESIYLLDLLDKNHLIDYFIQTIMVNENIQKVFHNASYDVRFLGGKDKVQNILCTYNDLSRKISLEQLETPNRQLKTLASYLCDFTIEENEQGSDWAIRPLTEKQLKYAAMDIIFLTQVHQKLENIYNSSLVDPPKPSNSLNITESAILFRITRTYSPDLSPEELYDATRGNWVLRKKERRENAEYGFAVYQGIVKQVYRIHFWHFSGVITNGNERYCFEGEIAEDKQHYIGMNVAHYFPRGYSSPTRYVNC
ncbi:hypothetical protein [Cyanobacterium aponinum]|uniref:hypothetical protein n=1 Tax=Cyanobacterium aponinum TaxID=379064 RepID=UPI000C12C4FF|nr:hypothetical protein [Cyanobacterium aponinum]PHV61563.1 hypothetical protein CSQ80_15045 [Cyanobacterium aponinum IPPAS B-1201]